MKTEAHTADAVRAHEPEDLTRLFVQLANAGDSQALSQLYEQDAVVAYPPGSQTLGRLAIERLYRQMLSKMSRFEPEESLPTLRAGDLALTSTQRRDGSGIRIQVARQQPDGSWLRVIDMPEPPADSGR